MALEVKNPSANAGDIIDVDSIPGSGRSSGGGHGNPLQYFCLENPMDRGDWWAIAQGLQRVGHDWSDLAHTQGVKDYIKENKLGACSWECSINRSYFPLLLRQNVSFWYLEVTL